MAVQHVERELTVYRGDEYIHDGIPLGKCIGCLYDGKGDEYGTYAENVKYIFSLNGIDTTYTTDELFNNHKAIVLVENTSKKDVCIKIKHNNKQKKDSHHIFNMHDIMIKLLFDSLPTLSIKDYINIIKMIVTFGRVNRLWYEASNVIKTKVASCLESLVPSYGIETFCLIPEVGKRYTSMIVKRLVRQHKQGPSRHCFGIKETVRYVGKCISREQTGCRDSAEYTYTFQKGEETIKIRLKFHGIKETMHYVGKCTSREQTGCRDSTEYTFRKREESIKIRLEFYGRTCFNPVEEWNINEDPCEIICIRNNETQSEEFYEREHLKHQYKILINKYLNIMIDKNVNKHEVDEAKNKVMKFVKKLWNINQPNQIKNY
jgi:hypothetical protein